MIDEGQVGSSFETWTRFVHEHMSARVVNIHSETPPWVTATRLCCSGLQLGISDPGSSLDARIPDPISGATRPGDPTSYLLSVESSRIQGTPPAAHVGPIQCNSDHMTMCYGSGARPWFSSFLQTSAIRRRNTKFSSRYSTGSMEKAWYTCFSLWFHHSMTILWPWEWLGRRHSERTLSHTVDSLSITRTEFRSRKTTGARMEIVEYVSGFSR